MMNLNTESNYCPACGVDNETYDLCTKCHRELLGEEPIQSTCVKCGADSHTIFEDGECGYCKDSHKETLEREHMGDFDKKTDIYAQPTPRLVNSRKLGSKKE